MRIDIHLQEKPLCVDFQLRLFEVDRSWAGSLFAHKCCDANLVSGRLFSKWNLSFNQTVLKEQSTELTSQVYNTVLIRCRLARWAIPAVQLLSASFKEAWRTVFTTQLRERHPAPSEALCTFFFYSPSPGNTLKVSTHRPSQHPANSQTTQSAVDLLVQRHANLHLLT